MAAKDILLSLDLGLKDCFYRIRREVHHGSKVIYVVVKSLDIIPEESQTYGPAVIRELSKLNVWYSAWNTLTVFKDEGGVRGEPDTFEPHALSKKQILGDYDLLSIFELKVIESVKVRVFRVEWKGRKCFLKIARFGFELDWLAQEIKVYHALAQNTPPIAPRILGYAFEEPFHRVVGFVYEEIIGRRPEIMDLKTCQIALQQLHDLDILHGDINRDNMFITPDGTKFIDFEDSCIGPMGNGERWKEQMSNETQSLAEKLLDETGRGRPLTLGNGAS
ncbi:hypothetical protein NUU61_001557 [Penicillium alfredii]|uniref:Aminoglycoside phosphotransferase domain-containing protein n=1 Tax=Penicillium alfredii TaxID=1506179 RepID=A0A9W9G4N4_9EURO|nr:uncharacterized protein NUU61_001557 [Penicillium alfredii]KAJ5111927.1 hypothetical protein NUU61_001557 [Penicillium alfredii]